MLNPMICRKNILLGALAFGFGTPAMCQVAEETGVRFKAQPTEAWSAVIPADKNLDPAWVESLFARGEPRSYTGEALMNVGMPVGGICAGLVYLGGDGKLWWWDIFNKDMNGVMPRQIQYKGRSWHGHPRGLGAWQGGNYVEPVTTQPSPFKQGFALKLIVDGKEQVRTLDRHGWKDVTFTGAYPYGTVRYADPACPVTVVLEAFSPYVPLDFDASSYPATLLRYRVENPSGEPVRVEVGGWMENAVLLDSARGFPDLRRTNTATSQDGLSMVFCTADVPKMNEGERAEILFEDFEKATYEGWKVEGAAFGQGPVARWDVPSYLGDLGMKGSRAVNSHATAPTAPGLKPNDANGSQVRDAATGKLISPSFTIERDYIVFLIGGGKNGSCGLQLVVDGKVALSVSGHDGSAMREAVWDVKPYAGKTAHLEVVDQYGGRWGHVGIDHIVFTDTVPRPSPRERPDWGSMALAAVGGNPSRAVAQLDDAPEQAVFADRGAAVATSPMDKPLLGGVVQTLVLAPGESGTAEFAIAWHFANTIEKVRGGETGHYYGKRFKDAAAVVRDLAANAPRLTELTQRWLATWYDSTLPYWFLERIFIPLDCLASTTCYRFADGRFYTYEGIRSCAGHPNHVWHYAQGHARLFPELEQDVIERVWYGFGFHEDGSMAFRGEKNDASAIDGHCGVILSVLRAHQTNPDDQFLRRIWPRVRKSIQYAISRDRDNDGLLDTPMHTTLDEPWYGEIPWISGLYIAALRAGEVMALEMGETDFAQECRERAAKGRAAMDAKLFNGEWFVQIPDPDHPKKLGAYETVHIDQVLGQAWAWQVGLGRVLNRDTTLSALRSIWKYNFARNLDAYDRQADPKGRPYYTDGEGGLVMTSNALGRKLPYGVYSIFACYLSETMNGFEYQAGAHMIAEGLVKEGLAVIRTIDERYDGRKRNPFNEVECGDHYARSMASYGSLIAISGFEYHGPKGHIGFAPRLTPEHFKAPFTASEGWGSYEQKIKKSEVGIQKAERSGRIALKYGTLRLKTVSLGLTDGLKPTAAKVSVNGRTVEASLKVADGKALVALADEITLKAGESLVVTLR